jgi:4-diphosphocytidyl-2-C-methyl-D-erythritol kinase
LPDIKKCWLVIMIPEVTVPANKTSALYARLSPGDYTGGQHTGALAEDIRRGTGIEASRLYNVFEEIACSVFPDLYLYRRALLSAGAARVHLAGSGPVLFTLHRDRGEAEEVARKLAGWPVLVADTLLSSEPC